MSFLFCHGGPGCPVYRQALDSTYRSYVIPVAVTQSEYESIPQRQHVLATRWREVANMKTWHERRHWRAWLRFAMRENKAARKHYEVWQRGNPRAAN